jgi:hypothetical protein
LTLLRGCRDEIRTFSDSFKYIEQYQYGQEKSSLQQDKLGRKRNWSQEVKNIYDSFTEKNFSRHLFFEHFAEKVKMFFLEYC